LVRAMPNVFPAARSIWIQRSRRFSLRQRRVGILLLILGVICVALIGMNPTTSTQDAYEPEPVDTSAIAPPLSPSMPAWKLPSSILPGAVTLPYQDPKRHPSAPSLYDQAMAVGYSAFRNQDYHTALINFERALEQQADDALATEAIRNTNAILQRQRQQDSAASPPPPSTVGADQ